MMGSKQASLLQYWPKTGDLGMSGLLNLGHCGRLGASIVNSVLYYGNRSQVVYSKQPKLGLTPEFVVLLVRMRLVVCLVVIACLFVCFTGNLGDWVL